jgi:hypothetical protein
MALRGPVPTATTSKWYAWAEPEGAPMLNAISGTGVVVTQFMTEREPPLKRFVGTLVTYVPLPTAKSMAVSAA